MAATGTESPRFALVTGAASGIGRLAAWRLAHRGATVAAIDRNEAGLAETVAANPGRLRAYPCDVSQPAAVRHVVAEVEDVLGPLDRVMNIAAIARVGWTVRLDPELVMRMMAINYGGVVNVCTAVLPRMLERGEGEVVNFASIAGWIPTKRMTAYAATKFAVAAYTEGLWLENRNRGVTISCVCPAAVSTPMLADFFTPEGQGQSLALAPDRVIDAVERGVAGKRLWIFPGAASKVMWRLRRLTPRLARRLTTMTRFDFVKEA